MLRALFPFLLATLLAAGLGGGATRLPGFGALKPAGETTHPAQTAAKADAHGKPADKGGKAPPPTTIEGVLALPPIVGPLRAPANVWARFEGAVVVEEMEITRAKVLAAEIADDTLVYLSTLTLPDLEGAPGLKAVQEDLLERARIRGQGKVRDMLIQTLVTQ